jgi:hypothetical protein
VTWPPSGNPWVLLAAAFVGVIAVARATRLITQDSWPPAVKARAAWSNLVRHGAWAELVECPFCAAPYLAAADLLWAVWSGLDWLWWVANVWAAGSYLASIVVVRDEPE